MRACDRRIVGLLGAMLLGCLLAPAAAPAADQEEPGADSADLGLTLSQTSYSDSWTGSEQGTVTWTFTGRILLQEPLGERVDWRNDLKLTYGQSLVQAEENGERVWQAPRKTSDRIFDEMLLEFDVWPAYRPYAGVTFDSQFYDGQDNPLSPAELTESLGVVRDFVTSERTELTSRLGPAVRHRFVYGMTTTTDGGLEWVTDLTHEFSEDLKLVSKLRVFQAVLSSADGEPASPGVDPDAWKTTDVALEATLTASVSRYVQTNLFFELLYDKQVSTDVRYRDVLGLGLAYSLF